MRRFIGSNNRLYQAQLDAQNARTQNLNNLVTMRGLQQSMDPNSLQNQLAKAQIMEAQRKAANPNQQLWQPQLFENPETGALSYQLPSGDPRTGGGAWSPMSNPQGMVPVRETPEQKRNRDMLIKLQQQQAEFENRLKYEPKLKSLETTAGEQAKQDVERSSPEAVAARKARYNDNMNMIFTVDDLQTPLPGEDTPLFTKAYGRSNVLIPDVSKPTGWVDAEAKRDQLIASLQLENVKKLKGTGPITENEQIILRRAATVLGNPLVSESMVNDELERVQGLFIGWAVDALGGKDKLPQVSTQSDYDSLAPGSLFVEDGTVYIKPRD